LPETQEDGLLQSQYLPPTTVCPAITGKDIINMSKQTDTSLFMHPSTSKLYQRLLNGFADYYYLGNRIIGEIKAAQSFRQIERVRQLADVLNNIPIKEYQYIAQYYLIWCNYSDYQYDAEQLEKIVDHTHTYKAKVLSSRAAIDVYQGNLESAFYFYTEALKGSNNISDYIHISRAIAVLKGLGDSHDTALADLESLLPILKHAEPFVFSDVLNSYAVELCEVGRLTEASNISKFIAASPFVAYYPEYRETISEVNQRLAKKRSTVRINLPDPEPEEVRPTAKVIPFPVKKASQNLPAKPEHANEGFTPMHLLRFILKSVLKEQVTEEQIEKVCSVFYTTLKEWWPEEQA
jgi:tetratricopeptide (TPR) repeat protein